MRKLIVVALFLATSAFSQIVVPDNELAVPIPNALPVPEEIIVIMKNGLVRRYSPSEWAVTRKGSVTNSDTKIVERVVTVVQPQQRNTVGVSVGYGFSGLNSAREQDGGVTIWKEKAPIVGAFYSRSMESWSLMLNWYSNETVALGSGLSF